MRDPLGNSTFTTWHPVFTFPLKEVLSDGATWQYEYNARGDMVLLVQFNLKPGTRAQLEGIGIRDKSDLTAVTLPDIPSPVKPKGWGLKMLNLKAMMTR